MKLRLLSGTAAILAAAVILAACGGGSAAGTTAATAETEAAATTAGTAGTEAAATTAAMAETGTEAAGKTAVLYMGQASLRITTPEDKVIYIDPFSGEEAWYKPAADLILVTHDHPDHNKVELIENRSKECRIISQDDAVIGGEHKSFDLGYVQIEAVEAENKNHDINKCAGYILTFSDGQTLYASGDTSTTKQMSELKEKHLDYAFFCCDGHFNMDTAEASECAKLVAARHSIPYHMAPGGPNHFDREIAEKFEADGRIIVEPGEELVLE